ncbi:DUF4153 domain-containing protein [Aureibacter tunicatorum]|uniref:DUF4153 domain-containing protein n=1 Tax=Aureibacter tunicatorum TaxID=866807 RepID=A0AAE4BRA2_9BACT|nr:DUF4153 domain-containing protein [Aureibacter tunicatorum]MDR6238451.1 hypothetical protein [Aureibacter tunicatorum]BDD05615.1 hypothetical protein AUTU_30980 [Aureibacter tunicatorum]
MKIPSLNYLKEQALKSASRFPLSLASAFIGSAIAIYLVENERSIDNIFPLVNLMLTLALAIPTFFCAQVLSEKESFSKKSKIIVFGAAFLFVAATYLSLPNPETVSNISIPYIRYGVFNVIAHLLVSFIPYYNKGEVNGFWNYNKTLFIRLCTSLLFSVVIYLGIVFLLFALDQLFNIDIHDKLFMDFWIFTIGIFNTWFFISGIPKDFQKLEEIDAYPKSLKIFSQYILLPLLSIYLIVLYAYGAKIIITWHWPKGIVSYMILTIAILGTLTLLLIYPYGKSKENAWINKFSRVYYFILVPLIALLFISISIRLNEYGITVNRYAIFGLGIWLSIIAGYFIFGGKNIKAIPQTLAFILILSVFGPWSMFNMGEKSQSKRLISILEQNGIIENGKIQNETIWVQDSLPDFYSPDFSYKNEGKLSDSLHNEVISIMDYLDDFHGYSQLSPYFKQNMDSLIKIGQAKRKRRYYNADMIYLKTMGIETWRKYNDFDKYKFVNYTSNLVNNIVHIKGYDWLYSFNNSFWHMDSVYTKTLQVKTEEKLIVKKDMSMSIIKKHDTLNFDLKKLVSNLPDTNSTLPSPKMTIYPHGQDSSTSNYQLVLKRLKIKKTNNQDELHDISGYLLEKEN